ncbi:MAG: hypothetical protein R6V01_00805 [Thermoplasmatota archaeon]
MDVMDERARKRFMEGAVNGEITCSKCLEIARDLDIDKGRIASALTKMDIKIVRCQLGCFG